MPPSAPVLRYSHPAKRIIHVVLDSQRPGGARGRVRRRAQGTSLSLGQRPNELWCTDYKGEFLLGNHQYCWACTRLGLRDWGMLSTAFVEKPFWSKVMVGRKMP